MLKVLVLVMKNNISFIDVLNDHKTVIKASSKDGS